MMENDPVSDLLEDIPGCRAATHANLTTRVTYRAASRSDIDQHTCESACARAAELLGDAPRPDGSQSDLAAVLTPDTTDLYLRRAEEPDEVIICTFGRRTSPNEALQKMYATSEKLSEH